jgi:NADH:ubiquinone oxidoreductase subunit C
MILTVRKKPVVVQAMLWTGDNWDELEAWCPYGLTYKKNIGDRKAVVIVDTLEGHMQCNVGDYIIKGVENEVYPIKKDIFKKTYEIVTEAR